MRTSKTATLPKNEQNSDNTANIMLINIRSDISFVVLNSLRNSFVLLAPAEKFLIIKHIKSNPITGLDRP
jgi:hypothetical protein